MTRLRKTKLLLILLLLTVLTVSAAGAETNQALSIPTFTESDCVWDEAGNLISETVRDLTGAPALNRRGFYRAEYTWDALNNLLTEAYFGLNGEPVNADGGFDNETGEGEKIRGSPPVIEKYGVRFSLSHILRQLLKISFNCSMLNSYRSVFFLSEKI